MTEIMPPISNMSSTEDDNDVAFKVLNNDNLPMAVIGESIRCPFGTDNQKPKPNLVVYPTRRVVNYLEENKQKPFAKSSGFINERTEKSPNRLRKNYSSSQGNLIHCNSASHRARNDVNYNQQKPQIDNTFTKTLDAKLKRLQKEEEKKIRTKRNANVTNNNELQNRPLFVTTVKKGQFLEPPPEIASLLGYKALEQEKKEKKKLYEYASKPRVFLAKPAVKIGHKARCEAAAKAAAIVAAVAGIKTDTVDGKDFNANITKKLGDAPLPYANLMYERRICRGSNYSQMPMQTGEGESAAARAAEARRRAMARRKAQKQQLRGAQLRLSSPPPVKGRRHEKVETDQYLEELAANPPMEDICTQTDLFLDRPISPFYVPAKTGADVSTQIYPGDLFDFDMEVQPILEVLVGKTIEQALIEVLEEEELAAMREQQRRFMEVKNTQLSEMQRLEEREKRWQAERDRRMAEYEEGLSTQKEMEERIAASVLLQGYMADLLPNVLEGLEDDGFLSDVIKQDLDESFMPWLMKEVSEELHEIVTSRDVLSEIVKEILENRAELYKVLYESKPEEAEEEGPTAVDIPLVEHMKLQQEIAEALTARKKTEEESPKAADSAGPEPI